MNPIRMGSYLAASAVMLVACARSDQAADTLQSGGAVAESAMSPGMSDSAGGGLYDSTRAAAATGSIATASAASVGTYLTDANGRALYMFEKDRAGASSCLDACAAAWPPFSARAAASTDASVSAAKVGTIERSDGSAQATYAGMPLYFYHDDAKPGDIKGQDKKEFGGSWYLVSPAGKKIEEHDE